MRYLSDFWYNLKLVVIDKIFNSLGYIPDLPEPDSDELVVYDENKLEYGPKPSENILIPFEFDRDNDLTDTDVLAEKQPA